jgi:hypothetical protein
MGTVADTSLRALQKETQNLRWPQWVQRYLFFRKAKGIHGVHSPLAYRLATDVFMKPGSQPIATRLQQALSDTTFHMVPVAKLSEALPSFPEDPRTALWVPDLLSDRARWLHACADARVTLAIDGFDCGLLLHTPEVREKQYLRQRMLPVTR